MSFCQCCSRRNLKIANIEECAVAIITVTNEAKLEILCQVLANYPKPIDTIIHVNGTLKRCFF